METRGLLEAEMNLSELLSPVVLVAFSLALLIFAFGVRRRARKAKTESSGLDKAASEALYRDGSGRHVTEHQGAYDVGHMHGQSSGVFDEGERLARIARTLVKFAVAGVVIAIAIFVLFKFHLG